ncbi:MAG: MarC family protein [Leptolyngbya sp. SIO3F4]|nr:MarC family protein [Leptolyngbya sp. SIO3F4]
MVNVVYTVAEIMEWSLVSNFAAAMVAIINPVGNVLLFVAYTSTYRASIQRLLAVLTTVTITLLLLLFLFTGQTLLRFFGISLAAFQLSGGILLLLIGIGMTQGQSIKQKQTIASEVDEKCQEDLQGLPCDPSEELSEAAGSLWQEALTDFGKIIVPLCVPIFVGPGSISTVIIYSSQTTDRSTFLGLVGVIILTAVIVLICLLLGETLKKVVNETGLDIGLRIFGLLLSAIGAQFILGGLASATNGLIRPEIVNLT